MKNMVTLAATLTIAVLALAPLATAAVPQMINYQGRLTDSGGDPMPDSSYVVDFRILTAPAGGSTLWEERDTITTEQSLFTVILGQNQPIPDTVFSGATRYLGIQLLDEPEFYPRTALITVPYAYHSLSSDTADFALSPGSGWIDDGTVVRLETETDRVGIGTTAPEGRLEIQSEGGATTGVATYPFRVKSSNGSYFLIHTSEDATGDAHLALRNGSGTSAIAFAADPVDNSFINAGNVGIGTTNPNAPLHIYKSTDATTSPQTLLQLHAASTGDYTDGSDFGPQISFRSEDSDAVNDDFEFARISGVYLGDGNYGKLNFDVLCNGVWRRLMTLSHPYGPTSSRGLSVNEPSYNAGVLNVTNCSANKYVAYFESTINTESNVLIDYTGTPQSGMHFLTMRSNTSSAADTKFRFQADGNACADGAWNGGGADYAEWFEKEGDITPASLVGLNVKTGKMRAWQTGDPFVGIQSTNPGFVGNNVLGAEGTEEELQRDHVLVALIGQVEIGSADIVEKGRQVLASDGQFIGWRLSNGKVFVSSTASGDSGMNQVMTQQSQRIKQLEECVAQLEASVETFIAQQRGSKEDTDELALDK